jgi:type IV secretory pathway TraG/TraD family ATPase VirD4
MLGSNINFQVFLYNSNIMGTIIALVLILWVFSILGQTATGIFTPTKNKKENLLIKTTKSITSTLVKETVKTTGKIAIGAASYTGKYVKNKLESPSTKFGGARFQKPNEIKHLLNSSYQGLCLNTQQYTLNLENSFKHLLLSAPSGMGKSTRFVVSSILNQLDNGGSIVVTDPSSEVRMLTSGYAARQGYRVKIINFSSPQTSLSYNPIEYVSSDREIANLANTLISSAFESTSGNVFWNDSAASLIESLIRLLKLPHNASYANLANVRHLLNNFGDGMPLAPLFIHPSVPKSLFSEFSAIIQQDPRVLQNIISTARTALKLFTDSNICSLSSSSSNPLDFTTIREERTIIYISCNETEIPHLRFFLKILYQQLFSFLTKELNPAATPVYMYLDEFPAMAIENIDSILSIIRKYRVSCSIITQNTSQLKAIYGADKAATIINGAISSKLFLAGLDIDSSKEVEQLLGTQTIEAIDLWTQEKDAPYPRALLLAQEIRTLQKDEAIFVHANKLPIKLKISAYYENSRLKQRTEITPVQAPYSSLQPVEWLPLLSILSSNTNSLQSDNDPLSGISFDL